MHVPYKLVAKTGPFNYNQGNLQQDAPPVAEFFAPSIFTTPPCHPTPVQPHSDADFAHPSHPFALVVNVPLVAMTAENGSTEVWLGTYNFGIEAQEGQYGERASGCIKYEFLERREREGKGPS